MIPEIDGTSRNQVQKFLNASTYAMSELNPADERSQLRAILHKINRKSDVRFLNTRYPVFCSTEAKNRNVLLIKTWHCAHIARIQYNSTEAW